MNILLIEDELLIQKSLKKLLEKEGASVTAVSQGMQAINLIYTNKYDRIICDLMLQDITGFDILEESKKIYSLAQISDLFVIITAYSSSQVLEKASQYQCQILNKPFQNIKDAIQVFLNMSSSYEKENK